MHGTGNLRDLDADFLSKPDPDSQNGRIPLGLFGEQKQEGEWFKFFGDVFKNNLVDQYPGGISEINKIVDDGRELLQKLADIPYSKAWFDRFAALNINPGNVADMPTDRVYTVPENTKRLGNDRPASSFYWLPVDSKGRLRRLPVGAASFQGLESIAQQTSNDPVIMRDIEIANKYVSLMHKVGSLVRTVLPRSAISNERLTPLALSHKSIAASLFFQVDTANKCFVWVNQDLAYDENFAKIITIEPRGAGGSIGISAKDLEAFAKKIQETAVARGQLGDDSDEIFGDDDGSNPLASAAGSISNIFLSRSFRDFLGNYCVFNMLEAQHSSFSNGLAGAEHLKNIMD